ncbi:MAG TPA: PKD domain-containing protein [Gaiellaceae bacterium]|nr:PKD domain-containing protein [Gaiellaceae bacterium]
MLGARIAVAIGAAVAAVLLSTGTAFGATVTKTLNFPLSGNSTTNIFNEPFSCCHIVVGSPLNIDTDIHGGIALDMKTSANAGTHNDLTFTDTNLRQGSTLDLSNTFTRDSQSLGVDYTLSGDLNVFGFDLNYNKTEGDVIANCGLPLTADSCSDTKSITLFDFTPIDIGVAYLQVSFNADITTSASISGDGVTSHRTFTAGGTDVKTPTDLTFTSTPQAVDESAPLPCTVPAGQPVNYTMGDESSHVNGSLSEGFGVSVQGDAYVRDIPPLPDIHLFTVGPFSLPNLFSLPPVTFNTITLSAPAQNVDLGTLLPNETAPTVAMDTIPTGTEGNPVQLNVTGTGPGGSLSPCGTSGLTFAWSFDDGGTASGQSPQHTFAEEGTHTGQVVVTDPTGLSTTLSFSVPVVDAPLTLSCATPPVSLQSFNGTVAALHDGNPGAPLSDFTATIDWGDGSTSSGTVSGSGGDYGIAGAHTYASTGYFDVNVHVDDEGGSTADTTKPCTVLVFAFAPGSGAFAVGDGSSGIGNTVTFWGAQWAGQNIVSGGTAPAAFKGYAKSPATPTCGATWTTDPGNSAPPPAGPLPAYMGVISTDSATKSGSQISGTTPHIVVVQTNPGYAPNPGHAGTGTVVAQAC